MIWKHKADMTISFDVENTASPPPDQLVSVVAPFGQWLLRESDKCNSKGDVHHRTGHEDPDGE
jgi:hypothetical protein